MAVPDGQGSVVFLEKLAAERPDFVREHKRIYRRALAKNYLRLGREILAQTELGRTDLGEARRSLARACRLSPWRTRALAYLLWSYAAPSTYSRFRCWELKHLERNAVHKTAARRRDA